MASKNTNYNLKFPKFQRKTDLNEYLLLPGYVEIDQVLSDYDMSNNEKLEYLNYLDFQSQIVLANLDKPSSIISYLLSLYPENEKEDMSFLMENLHIVITFLPEYNNPKLKGRMDILLDMIDDEIYRLLMEIDPETYGDGVLKNLRRMLSYANTGDDPQKEIDGLLSKKAGLQQNAVLFGDSPEITKTIKLLDIEILRLRLTHNVPSPIENKGFRTVQEKFEISKMQTEETPDHSNLLKALSAYITGISAPEFTNIVEYNQMTPGTPKAQWIGKPADAWRFATYIKMKIPDFNKCFSLSCGRKLKHNDKNHLQAPIIKILKAHLGN